MSKADGPERTPERGVAAAGALAGFGALFSAAACCVLPLALGALGLGAGGLAAFVPLRWPLTIASALVLSAGWLLYFRKRRACARGADCGARRPTRLTLVLLSLASLFVLLSAAWGEFETPLMRVLGGA